MNIHEYQAKALLKQFGVPVAKGAPAFSAEEAVRAAREIGGAVWAVKAQIHAGGRGKGRFKEGAAGEKGGVRVAKTLEDVRLFAEQMLGRTLVTHQSGPEGKTVKRIYIEQGSDIKRELYLSALVDRTTSHVAFIASAAGGMDIEEVAHTSPEQILSVQIDPAAGYQSFHGRRIAFALGLEGNQLQQCVRLVGNLYHAFVEKDASLIEVNPLVLTGDGRLICLDAKMTFDSNALFRHPDVVELRDLDEEDPAEVEASRFDLNYIKLDGAIGCMVNGAGLAMATMDIVKLYGSEPANFLDVGGGATKERVEEAFKIILSDTRVKGILVNIFGGIMRCDIIAEGIVAAAKEMAITVPLVVRLEGTNVELGRKILAESGLAIVPATDLADAAKKVVEQVKGRAA
jgi:succinyl-CoA synthetase beta subunit